tara:strand:- start:49 stop:1002 length:954 start_codon:yes stop_codon:yes gene_type:complete
MSRSAALQKKFKKSVSKARSRGIDSRKRKTEDRIKEQKQKIDQIRQSDTDNRSKFLQQQGGIQNLSNLLKKQQEETLRDSIKSSFGKGVVRKSDFLGRDPQGLFGLFGPETIAATTINPYSGERITTSKAREGLTTPEYSQFMSDVYNINPELGYETFTPGLMKLINKGMEIAAPFPLKMLASTMEGGKDIADYFTDKGSRAGTDITDQLKRYYEGIKSLNPFEEKPVVEDPTVEFLGNINPRVAPQGEDFIIPANFEKETIPVNKNIGINYNMADVPFDYFTNRQKGQFLNFNEGGLASLNNSDYNRLMGASNFEF